MPDQDPAKPGFAPTGPDLDRFAAGGRDDGPPDEDAAQQGVQSTDKEEDDEELELRDELSFPADDDDDQ